jgi:hypothetical protein
LCNGLVLIRKAVLFWNELGANLDIGGGINLANLRDRRNAVVGKIIAERRKEIFADLVARALGPSAAAVPRCESALSSFFGEGFSNGTTLAALTLICIAS